MKYFIDTEFFEDFHKPLFGKRRHFIDLISIGIVDESGREYYAISKDFDLKAVWNKYDLKPDIDNGGMKKVYWLRDNVLKPIVAELDNIERKSNSSVHLIDYSKTKSLIKKYGKSNNQIAEEIIKFVYPVYVGLPQSFMDDKYRNPEFYGYYADYDWVLFCSLFGRMIDLPTGFPMYAIDLKQMLDSTAKGIDGFTFEQSLSAIKNDPNYPKQTNEHNSLQDAIWNKKLYKFINTL